jgi:hypothetical protein
MGKRLTTPFARGADTLELRLVRSSDAQVATVDSYDFADHTARFGQPPRPRYVLIARRPLSTAARMLVAFQDPGTPEIELTVSVPAGTPAGAAFALDLPDSATGRVLQVEQADNEVDGRAEDVWSLTALLGNLATLLWVVGAERDTLREHVTRTVAQRHLSTAVGASLDLIGSDLGVPRFPPLPYPLDADTIALYHMDAAAGATLVLDFTAALPGRTGHAGQVVAPAQTGVPGRFGNGMGFFDAGASVTVPSSTTFDVPSGASLTVECFVRPDPSTGDGPVLIRQSGTGGSDPGWELAVGDFGRGVPRNVRLFFFDGTTLLQIFADVSLPTDAFTHLAGVLEPSRAELFVDGVLRASQPIGALRGIVSSQPLRIGSPVGAFRGVIDEVRLSSVARTSFAPALGEADDHYRQRLRLFRRWSLPTPANLTETLNEAVGPIGGQAAPLVVDDVNATLVRGTRLVQVRPKALRPGECIDGFGRRGVSEAEAAGTPSDEPFDPAYLFTYDRTTVDFTLPTTGGPANPHAVQIGLVKRLDKLITLAGQGTGPPGRLLIQAAFDPDAPNLRSVGRAVLLGHSSVDPGGLAALAHQAGFDFVCYRTDLGAAAPVYAASAPRDQFAIDLAPKDDGPTEVTVGTDVALSLQPVPPPDAFVRWLVVPGGPARATVQPQGPVGSTQQTAILHPVAPGQLVLKAEVTRGRHTVAVTHLLRIGVADLGGHSIAADGTRDVPPSIVERQGTFFHRAFLAQSNDPRADYGTQPNNHLMQPAVAELFTALLDELDRRSTGGRLSVTSAFTPADPPLDPTAAEGRQLMLRHSVLAPGALAAVAFAVGFDYATNVGPDAVVRQSPGQLVEVRGPAGVDITAELIVQEGDTLEVTATPDPATLKAAQLSGPPNGADPRLIWAAGAFDVAQVSLNSTTAPAVQMKGVTAGTAWVQASYLLGPGRIPTTFQVRLRPELDTPGTVITKDQYDLIMNVLNTLHPAGVEVDTSAIRSHVIEIQGDLQQINPEFTFPKFRVRGPLPRRVRGRASG